MTSVSVYSRTHSITYVADNILKSIKDIIRLTGLDPAKFVGEWDSNLRAIRAWLESEHLDRVTLQIYDPQTNALIVRWDLNIVYGWADGDGSFWTDTSLLQYHIMKAGFAPSQATYDLTMSTKPGYPSVDGWTTVQLRSTEGMVRQSTGSTVEHNGLGANTSYWRKL